MQTLHNLCKFPEGWQSVTPDQTALVAETAWCPPHPKGEPMIVFLLPLFLPLCILLGQMAHADFCGDSGGRWDYGNQICALNEPQPKQKR